MAAKRRLTDRWTFPRCQFQVYEHRCGEECMVPVSHMSREYSPSHEGILCECGQAALLTAVGESQAGGIDESPDSWPAWVICQEFHYWTASNLWRGVFIVEAQITGGPLWSSNRRSGICSWRHITSNTIVCRSELSIKSTWPVYFYQSFGSHTQRTPLFFNLRISISASKLLLNLKCFQTISCVRQI